MSHHIPFEIQEEIIKRLPVKSLIRFRSVSKPWNSLIDSSKFIANYHVHIHHPRPQHHILVNYTDRVDLNFYEQYVSIADDDTFPRQKLSMTLPELVYDNMKKPSLTGYSKGLFCFYCFSDYSISSDSNTAVLWNPAIRKSVSIVVPDVLDGRRYQAMIGFGVCPHTSDPKLVKIAQHGGSKSNDSIPLKAEIFTLSTGAWRSLFIDQPHGSISIHDTCVAIDKFIYWLAYEGFDERVIMSFDMTIEELKLVYLPDSIAHNYDNDLSLSNLKESLVLLEYNYKDGKSRYDVWMMKHGVPKSFTMLFSIDSPNFSIRGVLGFRMNGEPIIKMQDSLEMSGPNTIRDLCGLEVGVGGRR